MTTQWFQMHAEVCKTLSHAKRLEILGMLRDDELSVTEIVDNMGVSTANVSQHLAVLRNSGILKSRRDGKNIYYSISNRKVIKACDLMQEVLIEQHSQRGKDLSNRGLKGGRP